MLAVGGDSDGRGPTGDASQSLAIPQPSTANAEQDDHCKAGPSGIPAAHPNPSEENNDAAADRLRQRRIDAPGAIDEGSFSCVADPARALA